MISKYTKSTRARLEMHERQNRWLTVIAVAIVIALFAIITGTSAITGDPAGNQQLGER